MVRVLSLPSQAAKLLSHSAHLTASKTKVLSGGGGLQKHDKLIDTEGSTSQPRLCSAGCQQWWLQSSQQPNDCPDAHSKHAIPPTGMVAMHLCSWGRGGLCL